MIRGSTRDYRTGHPGPPNVALVVEVAGSTLARDREWKRRIYAAAGIPCYWLVDLASSTLEVYADPADGDYRSVRILSREDSISLAVDGQDCGLTPVASLLP